MEIKNWAENISIKPHRLISPTSIDEVIAAIQDAESEAEATRLVDDGKRSHAPIVSSIFASGRAASRKASQAFSMGNASY